MGSVEPARVHLSAQPDPDSRAVTLGNFKKSAARSLLPGCFSGIMDDREYMRRALELAAQSAQEGEVPVGALVVRGGQIVGEGRNRREAEKSALSHAELEAIRAACASLGGWRLWDCTLYVTLEPCPMCAGAILNARIPRVVFGASDPKAGSLCSVQRMFDYPYNHKPQIDDGILEQECADILKRFFADMRKGVRKAPLNPNWVGFSKLQKQNDDNRS